MCTFRIRRQCVKLVRIFQYRHPHAYEYWVHAFCQYRNQSIDHGVNNRLVWPVVLMTSEVFVCAPRLFAQTAKPLSPNYLANRGETAKTDFKIPQTNCGSEYATISIF